MRKYLTFKCSHESYFQHQSLYLQSRKLVDSSHGLKRRGKRFYLTKYKAKVNFLPGILRLYLGPKFRVMNVKSNLVGYTRNALKADHYIWVFNLLPREKTLKRTCR